MPRSDADGREAPLDATLTSPHAASASSVTSVIREAFRAFDTAHVTAVLLRDEVEAAMAPGDIDLLIEPNSWGRAEDALASIGYVRIPAWGHGYHRFFLRFATGSGWTKLDVVDRLAFGRFQSLTTGVEAAVLARRVSDYVAWRLHPHDAAWALLLHVALDASVDASMARAEQLRAMASSASDDGPLARRVGTIAGARTRAALFEAARMGDASLLRRAAIPLARAWKRRYPAARAYHVLRGSYARKAARLLVPLRRRGMTVAILGPDGSGKSTAALELQRHLPMAVRSVYMGMYARPAPALRGLGFIIRVTRLWRGAMAARWHVLRGRIVVFDRYSYDALLPARRGTPRIGRLRRWLLAHSVPAPDMTVLLDAPADQLVARKDEQTLDELERQRHGYRLLRDQLPHLVMVDAGRPLRDVTDEIAEHVWHHLRRRLAREPR